MKQGGAHESKFDIAAGRFLDGFAQRVSRRGILARLGKFALTLLGLTLVPNLPLNRVCVVEAQNPSGASCDSDWRLCGIYGNLCKACCGGSASKTSCPSCTTRGSSWSRCCRDPNGNCKWVSYFDCCGGGSDAANCKGTWCQGNCGGSEPNWCGGAGGNVYRCTIVSVGGSCSTGCQHG